MKIAAVCAMLLLLITAGGIWSYFSFQALTRGYQEVVQRTYPLALMAEQVKGEMLLQSQLTMAYAATRDDRSPDVRQSRARVKELISRLDTETANDPQLAEAAQQLAQRQDRFYQMVDSVFAAGDQLSNQQLFLQADSARSGGELVGRQADQLRQLMQARVTQAETGAQMKAQQATAVLAVITMVSICIGLAASLFVYRAVALPLRTVATQLHAIAAGHGDLRGQIRVHSADEIGLLAGSFNQLVVGLAAMVQRIQEAAEELLTRSQEMESSSGQVFVAVGAVTEAMGQVSAGAESQANETTSARQVMAELVRAIDQIATGAQQQAMQVQQATVVINSMVQSVEQVADQASSIAHSSREAAAVANKGATTVDHTLLGMNRVRDRVIDAARKVAALGEHGNRIGEIMKVITEIADQTNLLALNAAIEAARAGEQGRGFAVVAEEVRKLAARSANSAMEIRSIIQLIQAETQEAIRAIKDGSKEVEGGAQLAASAGEALQTILSVIERTTTEVGSISAAAQSVLSASHNAAQAVEEVAAVTEENSAATEQMAAGADQVQEAILGVNDVAYRNVGAVSEISSVVEECNASVGQIAETARMLSRVAAELRGLVGQFRI